MIDYLSGRYGRRGAWLIVLGAAWVVVGISTLLSPLAPRPWVLYEQVPLIVQASAWWLTGAVAIWQGLRGPARHDYLGHVALYFMPAVRAISFTLSWLIWLVTSALASVGVFHPIGWSEGWYAALVWFLLSLTLRLIADWPNPTQPIPRPPADASERL